MLTTSCFSSSAPRESKVCIAKKCPAGFAGLHVLELAPENPWAKGDWRARYRAELERRFPTPEFLRAILDRIQALVPEPILCCYEKNPSECHRRVLAQYVWDTLGLTVPEWTNQPGLLDR